MCQKDISKSCSTIFHTFWYDSHRPIFRFIQLMAFLSEKWISMHSNNRKITHIVSVWVQMYDTLAFLRLLSDITCCKILKSELKSAYLYHELTLLSLILQFPMRTFIDTAWFPSSSQLPFFFHWKSKKTWNFQNAEWKICHTNVPYHTKLCLLHLPGRVFYKSF